MLTMVIWCMHGKAASHIDVHQDLVDISIVDVFIVVLIVVVAFGGLRLDDAFAAKRLLVGRKKGLGSEVAAFQLQFRQRNRRLHKSAIVDGEIDRRLPSILHFEELDPWSLNRLAHDDFAVGLSRSHCAAMLQSLVAESVDDGWSVRDDADAIRQPFPAIQLLVDEAGHPAFEKGDDDRGVVLGTKRMDVPDNAAQKAAFFRTKKSIFTGERKCLSLLCLHEQEMESESTKSNYH